MICDLQVETGAESANEEMKGLTIAVTNKEVLQLFISSDDLYLDRSL